MSHSGPWFQGKQHPGAAEKGEGWGLPHQDRGAEGCVATRWDPGHCAGCRCMAAKAVRGGQACLMPGLPPWVGHHDGVCVSCGACEQPTERHFLEELSRVVTLTWQAPFQALHQGLCASMRHSSAEAGCLDGKWGWSPAIAWAARPVLAEPHSRWPWDASTRSLHSVLGSHLAERTGNLDDLELLWPPVLDDFPLPAASLPA